MITDGSSQTVLSGGLNVAGVSATGAQLTNASGAVTFTAGGPLSVDGGSGGTTGIVLADGTDQTTDLAGDRRSRGERSWRHQCRIQPIRTDGGGNSQGAGPDECPPTAGNRRSEEHTSELQSLVRTTTA